MEICIWLGTIGAVMFVLGAYHKWLLQPELQRFADEDRERAKLLSLRIEKAAQCIQQDSVETLSAYHEMRLLPALQLLASQRIDCAPPPEVVEEPAAKPKIRPQLEADKVENIWTRVAGTC